MLNEMAATPVGDSSAPGGEGLQARPIAVARPQRGRLLAEVVFLAVAVAIGLGALGPGSGTPGGVATGAGLPLARTASGDRTVAASLARDLLETVRLPPGSVRVARAPDPTLSQPSQLSLSNDQVTLTEFWLVPQSTGAFERWTSVAPEAGLHAFEGGTGYDRAKVVEHFLAWQLERLPPGMISATVGYGFVGASPSHTALRVDVQVIWRPARSAGSLIPRSDHYAELKWEQFGTQVRSGVVAISDSNLLRTLIAQVNALPAVPGGVESCPAALLQTTLSFAHGQGSPANAVLSYSGCDQFTLTTPEGTVLLATGSVLPLELKLIQASGGS